MSTVEWTQKISYSQSCFNEMIKATTNTHLSGHRGDFRSSAHSLHCSGMQDTEKSLSGSSPAGRVTTVLSVHGTSPIKSASLQHSSTSVCETSMSVSPPSGKERIQQVIKEKKIQTTKNLQYRFFPLLMRMFFCTSVFCYLILFKKLSASARWPLQA